MGNVGTTVEEGGHESPIELLGFFNFNIFLRKTNFNLSETFISQKVTCVELQSKYKHFLATFALSWLEIKHIV